MRHATLLVCLALTPAWAEGETWTAPEAGVTLSIPAGWTAQRTPQGEVLRRIDGASAGVLETISATVLHAPTEGLEALEALVRQQVEDAHLERLERAEISVGGVPAIQLDCQGAVQGVALRWRLVAFVHAGQQVVVNCTVLDDRWESTRPVLDTVLAGAQLVEPRPPEVPAALHPTAGISLVPPPGWRPLPPHSGGMWLLSRWGLPHDGTRMQAVIDLRGEPAPPGTALEQVLQGLPQQTGMQLAEQAVAIGGEPARVLLNDAAEGQAPRRLAVCVHEGVIFTLALIGSPEAVPAWEQALASLTWHERGEPSRFLDRPGAPIALAPTLGFVPPGLLRMLGQNKGELRLGIHDYKRGQGGMMLQVQVVGTDPSVPTAEVCQRMSQQIGQQLGGAQVQWERVGGKLDGFLTRPLPGQPGQRLLFSLLRPTPSSVAVINAVIFDERPEAVDAYRLALARILASAFRPQDEQPGGGQPGEPPAPRETPPR